MGLDQYWLRKPGTDDGPEAESEEIAYHRKFNALEGFMAAKWTEETGEPADEFNCKNLVITSQILDDLETAIREDSLDPVGGFFFGSTEKDEWYRQDVDELVNQVIPKVRQRLAEGETIIYTSWW